MKYQNIAKNSFEFVLVRSFSVAMAVAVAAFLVLSPGVAEAKGFFDLGFLSTSYMENADLAHGLPLSDGEREPQRAIEATVTAYSSTVDQCDDSPFIGADGATVYDGMVAANFLPFGTLVRFPDVFGDKVFRVDDRMNTRYGYGRVDVWMNSRTEAKLFGVKHTRMEIVGNLKVVALK